MCVLHSSAENVCSVVPGSVCVLRSTVGGVFSMGGREGCVHYQGGKIELNYGLSSAAYAPIH